MTNQHRHDALLYGNTNDLLVGVLVALGQEAGADDFVVLACRPQHNEALATAIRTAVPDLSPAIVMNRPGTYMRPAAALATQRRLPARLSRPTGAAIWYICEPDHGTTASDWNRTSQYEAACTITLGQLPLTTVCAYQRGGTPVSVMEAVMRTHPRLITGVGPAENPSFRDPFRILAELTRSTSMPEPEESPVLHVAGSVTHRDIRDIRARISDALAAVPTLTRTDIVAAVNEALTNAYVHGTPPVDVKVWNTRDHVECRISDHGTGFNDPLAGYLPETLDDRTRTGLWLARQACDDIDMWRHEGRFTVRLAARKAPGPVLQTHGALARAETAKARALLAHRRHGRLADR
jgi:anti-sigma regulatory factor (Ser/Thr protein kinase)